MPELPEVETIARGLQPALQHQKIQSVAIRHHQLRWPVPNNLSTELPGLTIKAINRRAKYIVLTTDQGSLLIHLGMSGRIQLHQAFIPPKKHDHIDIAFTNQMIMRFTDPRRFGAFLWTTAQWEFHPLLKNLGPEPLDKDFSEHYLQHALKNRSAAIKNLIMNNNIVVGVGNIYAAESLFLAGINPSTRGCALTLSQIKKLVRAIKIVINDAIELGGTTLKDFADSNGNPGYFSQQLKVYGRKALPCFQCKTILRSMTIAGRSTVFCTTCQQ